MPKIVYPTLPVCDADLANLRASGLTDQTIWENDLRTVGNALYFDYRDLDGRLNGFARRRPHNPLVIDGRKAKYVQPRGAPARAYYPKASLAKLRDGASPVYVTEGEKKALALSQLGLAAVGLGGFWCGCKKGDDGQHELIDDLTAVGWQDRVVYVVFDYDAKAETRREADGARARLAKALKAAGAREICNVELPPGPGGVKQGVDDFLVANGARGAKAFAALVEKSRPVNYVNLINNLGGSETAALPLPQLGEAAYHGIVGEFLRAVAPHTEATDVGVLAHLLPAVATLIGPGPHHWAGNKQSPRINTVLVGPTSTGRKGTALAPVDLLMARVDEKFWRVQRVGGLSTGEGLIKKVADYEEWNDELKVKELVIAEKRLYVVEEEFSKILAQLRRETNILSQILRECYDSGNLAVLTRADPLQACGAHVCVTGHITPEELADRLNHIEMANGFGNRFLWFRVKSDKIIARSRPIPQMVFLKFLDRLRAVSDLPEKHIPLADDAADHWAKEVYPSLREDLPGLAGAMIARGSSMVLRLALIYCLLDDPKRRDAIRIDHLGAALAVWRYCEASAQMLFQSKSGSPLGDKLLILLEKGPMSKQEFNAHTNRKPAEIQEALEKLETAGLVKRTQVKRDGPGRPAERWERVAGTTQVIN